PARAQYSAPTSGAPACAEDRKFATARTGARKLQRRWLARPGPTTGPSPPMLKFDRCDEVRAVDREQRLAAADVLISRIREHLLDPSGETRLHVALQPFVGLDVAGGVEAIAYVLSHHDRELESDPLPALRRDPYR